MNNREAFEAWHKEKFPNSTFERWMSISEPYMDKEVQARFEVWQAALSAQAQQPTKLVFDSESARQFLLENVLPKFSDSTFQKYVLEELAGDFAYQLVMYLQSQAQQTESQWSPIETAPKNKKIIVRYKNSADTNRTVFAKYIEKFTEESTCDTECETDYSEDDDTFYLKEGWVELIDNWDEFSSVYFDSRNVPTHWMPIPPAPEGGE